MSRSHNRVAVLHGVNFDILERRDAAIYGGLSLDELERRIGAWARELGLEATFFQTNSEGEFVEYLHRLPDLADAVVVNAGAWTHYSRAIADALDVAGLPAVEVHLSDVESRDDWRRRLGLRRPRPRQGLGQGPGRLPRGARDDRRRARGRHVLMDAAAAIASPSWSPSASSTCSWSPSWSTSAT